MPLVIDDHLLLDVLTEQHDDWIRTEMKHSALYRTGAWYYRLAGAAHRGIGTGSLSGRLAGLDPDRRRDTLDNLRRLPDWIGLIRPRLLIPVMARLDVRRRPNVLAAEALALALVTNGTLVVAVDGPVLRDGANDLDISYEVRDRT